MAIKVQKPKKRKGQLGTPPQTAAPAPKNLHKPSSGELAPLNFYVPPDFRREYKIFAAERDMNMVDVLKQSFELYKAQNPS